MLTTFPALLAAELRRDPGRPLVTYYDLVSGERTELSVATYANWVAKTAGLLQDEYAVERGGRVLVDLPVHWLGPVWLGAAWSVGAAVVRHGTADLVACGPSSVEHFAQGGVPVVAMALRPMAGRFVDPLPAGVTDFSEVVWGEPDAFGAWDPPTADDVAWQDGDETWTQADVVAAGADPGSRLITRTAATEAIGVGEFMAALRHGHGVVYVAGPDDADLTSLAASERAQPARS